MKKVIGLVAVGLAVSGVGCAARRAAPVSQVKVGPATRPLDEAQGDTPATMSLDRVLPAPRLPEPTTRATGDAPPDALVLYARARDAMDQGQRFTAINLLEQAVKIDPYSYDLYYSLGEAYLGGNVGAEKSIDAFEAAARIRPDDLRLQTQLGRQYLAKDDTDKALEHLRLATVTSDYGRDEDGSAVADYFLARALQAKGYDRAALDEYTLLLKRLASPSLEIRDNPELSILMNRPEVLFVQVGELYEKHKQYDDAVKAYEAAAEREPANFDLQARVVHALMTAGRRDEAGKKAGEVVAKFRADAASMTLMREVYKAQGGNEAAVVAELGRLHQEQPDDRAILFAYADALKSAGKATDAEAALRQALGASPADMEILRRDVELCLSQGDTTEAARALIEALGADPDSLREITPLWADLVRPSQKNRLRISVVQGIEVTPRARAAKAFFVSRMADLWNRDALARTELEKAVQGEPPLAPAYRSLLAQYLARPDWDDKQKADAGEKLAARAQAGGNKVLAAELRALVKVNQKDAKAAAELLGEAIQSAEAAPGAAKVSPETQLNYATLLRLAGEDSQAEQALWKLIGERSTYADAYKALFSQYLQGGAVQQAVKVLQTWLAADPSSVQARLLQAAVYAQAGRQDMADAIMARLMEEHPEDPEVLENARDLAQRAGKLDQFTAKLQDVRKKDPENRTAVEELVGIYAAQGRTADAVRVLDATRAAVKGDEELMYYVSHLYEQVGQKDTCLEILEEITKLNPHYAPAANDLGYSWADEGKNLDRAEQLIRAAVEEEPDNQAFLDSLGWVLYKRGKFDEARGYIEKALGPAARPDPVVVDHLGDVEYRLGDKHAAMKTWRRAQGRLAATPSGDRDDLRTLGLQLKTKIGEVETGRPASVAPTVAESIGAKPAADVQSPRREAVK